MSDIQNANKDLPAGEEIAKDKIPSQEMTGQETVATDPSSAQKEKEKGFLTEAAGNIGEGAKRVGEKAAELTDTVVEKLKKGWSQAYGVGAKVVDDVSQAAHDYAEKYKAESEIKKLNGKKDLLLTQLGHSIFKCYLEKGKVVESFFNGKEIMDQFNQIEIYDQQIIDIGKQLDKAEE
ncbi:MAG: hypothetical protein P1P89_10405 [Desulfobacterales bacterium]|nr:hypothetical protein [Desulfobacterales bacterium]